MVPGIAVLHVDDEPDFSDLVEIYLERECDEIEVTAESDSTAVLDLLETHEFDCIVSDFDMPSLNGVELLKRLREEGHTLPFILYTGKGSEEVASEAISAGVDDYLQKRTNTEQYTLLTARIRNLVSKHRAETEVERMRRYYEKVLQRSSDYVMILDRDANLEYISPAVKRVIGYTASEITRRDVFDFAVDADRTRAREFFQRVVARSGEELTTRLRVHHADGSSRWIELRARDLTTDPIIRGVIVNARDVTESVEDLQCNESIIENLPGYVYRHHDEEGWPLEFVRGSAERVTGYTTEELENEVVDAEDIIYPDDRDLVREIIVDCIRSNERFDETYRIITKRGDVEWIRDQGHVIDDPLTGEQYLDGFINTCEKPRPQPP
ncbi:PAS domain-containing protein [Halorubrum sp. JWXQ-INN 858]|nr:PAS domain-containing protein [Halorubrum sp. JWXQ-INN 858]